MSGFGLIVSMASLFVAVMALWIAWRLRQELAGMKRERYYLEQKMKSVSPQIEATVEPLRIQTALLAQGKQVSDRLIRTGRLYHEISAKEAEEVVDPQSGTSIPVLLDGVEYQFTRDGDITHISSFSRLAIYPRPIQAEYKRKASSTQYLMQST